MLYFCFLIHSGNQTIKNTASLLILCKKIDIMSSLTAKLFLFVFPEFAQISEDRLTW